MKKVGVFVLLFTALIVHGRSTKDLDQILAYYKVYQFEEASTLVSGLNDRLLANELTTLGDLLYFAGQRDSALFSISAPSPAKKATLVTTLSTLNSGYFKLYYHKAKGDAFKYFHQALVMARTIKNKAIQRAALLGILEYYNFEIAQNSQDQDQYLDEYMAIGTDLYDEVWAALYGMIFYSKTLEGEFDSRYFSLAEKLDVLENELPVDNRLLPRLYFEKGLRFEIQEKLADAKTYFDKALESAKEYPFLKSIRFFSLLHLSNIAEMENDDKKALEYVLRAKKHRNLADSLRSDYYINLYASFCYNELGKFDSAYVLLKKAYFAEYELDFRRNTMEINRLNVVLETQQKELENYKLRQNSIWLLIGLGVVLALLVFSYFGYKNIRSKNHIIQREKDRSESLLLNILPAEIAEELKLKGRADARTFDRVSVLFADFEGFTRKSAKLSARELIDELNDCFKAFDQICEKYGIEKIKTIGDAYMAAGGLPVPTGDSVKNTILAAIEMVSFVADRIVQKQARKEIAFEIRIGIHTGPIVAGIVGVKKFQFDIWGNTVNTASRMESNGEAGKVNISQHTYELVKDEADLAFEKRGKIEAKGIGKVEMYFVTKA